MLSAFLPVEVDKFGIFLLQCLMVDRESSRQVRICSSVPHGIARTIKLSLECLDFSIGIVNDFIHCSIQVVVVLSEVSANILVIRAATESKTARQREPSSSHFLCDLISPKRYCPACTFHNRGWIESAEDAGLVFFRRVEARLDRIVDVGKVGCTNRTTSLDPRSIGQAGLFGACNAENVSTMC